MEVIHKAWFQEGVAPIRPSVNTDSKRSMKVRISYPAAESNSCSATIWVYSLDGRDLMGPFRVTSGDFFIGQL